LICDISGTGTVIIARPTAPIDLRQVQVKISIYDALGYEVVDQIMKSHRLLYYFQWDGYNRNGRTVGTGTYLAVVTVRQNNRSVLTKRLRIGVKR
jgi:flagellar hook assembly protein FlgD